ncbi:MAG: hypothetical protein MJ239_05400 [Bacilli bacterium]|nr:hypothetical protein [Bacilli bacterium]
MKNKKTLYLGSALLLSAGLTAVVGIATANGGALPNLADGPSNEVWNHYAAVEAGTTQRGIKEYWVSCDTHETVFTAPTEGTISDKGAPSQAFINRLPANDARLVKQLGKIDFEDASDLNLFENTIGTLAIVESADATSGNKVLQVTPNSGGSIKWTLKDSVLDKLFADPSVHSIAFDARGEAANGNFRRNSTGSNITYEIDDQGRAGLKTEWKTFYFERGMYDQYVASKAGGKNVAVLVSDGNATNKVFFDNIRICQYAPEDMQYQGFEGGSVFKASDTDYRVSGYARTATTFPTSKSNYDLYITGDAADFTVSHTTEIVSEGRRALKIEHTGLSPVTIRLNAEFANNANADGIMFDVYWDGTGTGRTEINFAAQVGMSKIAQNHNLYSGCWSTGVMPKSAITTQTGAYYEFLKLGGSQCNGTFIIDNIRPYYATEGFEAAGVATSSSNVEISSNIAPDSQFKMGSNRRDKNDHVFYINGNGASASSCITDEFYTQGTKSFKYVHEGTNTNFNIYVNKAMYGDKLDAAGVSIDVLTFDGKIERFMGNQTVNPDGEWHTYTITKEQMNTLRATTHYCLAYNASAKAGTYYFDNLRFLNK